MSTRTAGRLLALALALVIAGPADALPIRGAVAVRTITVADPDAGESPQRSSASDVTFAAQIFGQIGITLQLSSTAAITRDDPGDDASWSGNDFRGDLIDQARGGAGEVHVYYVGEHVDSTIAGFAVSEEDVMAPNAPRRPGAIVDDDARPDTFAHEIGHVLLDEFRFLDAALSGQVHSDDADQLMASGGIRSIPMIPADSAPSGTDDQIDAAIGALSTDMTARPLQIAAMYDRSSFVTGIVRDTVRVELGGDGVRSGAFRDVAWGLAVDAPDPAGNVVTTTEAARRVSETREELVFILRARDLHAAGAGTWDVWLESLDSLEGCGRILDPASALVEVFASDPAVLGATLDATAFDLIGTAAGCGLGVHLAVSRDALSGNRGLRVSFDTVPDGDTDGVADSDDNCPAHPNPDQADLDGDGLGDVCDSDRDGDGIDNATDVCPDVADPEQRDLDGDGLGDVCDGDDADLVLRRLRVRRATARPGVAPNGHAIVRGEIVDVSSVAGLDLGAGLLVELSDGTRSLQLLLSPSDCRARKTTVTCKSGDGRIKARLKTLTAHAAVRFHVSAKRLDVSEALESPVHVRVVNAPAVPVLGFDRVGTFTDCRRTNAATICR